MPGNPVVPRQPLVDERVVGAQQIEDAAILAQRAGDEQLRFLLERLQQALVEVRDRGPDGRPLRRRGAGSATGRRSRRRARRRRAGSASMRRTCCSSIGGFVSCPRSARSSRRSSGMLLHRKNDSREASSRSLSRYVAAVEPSRRRIAMHAQQEVGIDEHALERELNARVEAAAVAPAVVEELEQRLARRLASPAGDRRAARASTGSSSRRRARRPRSRAGRRRSRGGSACPSPVPVDRVRTADLDRADARVVHVDLVVRQHPAALQRLRQAFRLPQLPHERHADDARSRLDRHADLEPGVAGRSACTLPIRERRQSPARRRRRSSPRPAGPGASPPTVNRFSSLPSRRTSSCCGQPMPMM